MKPNLEILNQIQQVEPPPFLFTRIQAKIDNDSQLVFSTRLAWSLGISFFIVIVMNFAVINYNSKVNASNSNVAVAMDLMPNNNLY